MKILVPNATNSKNLGDLVMLESLLELLRSSWQDAIIVVHQISPEKLPKDHVYVSRSLVDWIAFSDTVFLYRVMRTLAASALILAKKIIGLDVNVNPELDKILVEYRSAELIVFVGNGVLRSKKGIRQTVFLLLQLLPYLYSLTLRKPILVSPCSLGPFAYFWQEKLVMSILGRVDALMVREPISYALTRKYSLSNSINSYDHALRLMPCDKKKKTIKKLPDHVAVSVRQWYEGEAQRTLEQSIVDGLTLVNRKRTIVVHPLVQVHAPEHQDIDLEVSLRLRSLLTKQAVRCTKPLILDSVIDACRTYSTMDVVLGMRMHANIIAFTQEVPFVAIAYEYKTTGICNYLGMSDYVLDCDKVDGKKLAALLVRTINNREQIADSIRGKLTLIQRKIEFDWKNQIQRFSQAKYNSGKRHNNII